MAATQISLHERVSSSISVAHIASTAGSITSPLPLPVTAAMLMYKKRNGGHIGILCQYFLLFHQTNIATGHMSENYLLMSY